MPTNLSTTSPFFIASTVGTADTWGKRNRETGEQSLQEATCTWFPNGRGYKGAEQALL